MTRYIRMRWQTFPAFFVTGVPIRNCSGNVLRTASPLLPLPSQCRTLFTLMDIKSLTEFPQLQSNHDFKTIQKCVSSLADSVYRHIRLKYPWICQNSRAVAFAELRKNGKFEDLDPLVQAPGIGHLSKIIMESMDQMSSNEMTNLFLNLTHIGLKENHPLMTELFVQLESMAYNLDFLSLGRFLTAVENYSSCRLLVERFFRPQLIYQLRNGHVKFKGNPKGFLEACCQYSSSGVLLRLDKALLYKLLSLVLGICTNGLIDKDLNLVVPVFDLTSLYVLGDHHLPFIDPNIQAMGQKILRSVINIIHRNMERLDLRQLGVISKMKGDEHLEMFSSEFLMLVQFQIESVLMKCQHISTCDILEMIRFANHNWVTLSVESQEKLSDLTKQCLTDFIEVNMPHEVLQYMIQSELVVEVLLGDFSPSVKDLFKDALLNLDTIDGVGIEYFCKLHNIVNMYDVSPKSRRVFTRRCQSETLNSPLFSMHDKIRRLCYVMLTDETVDPSCYSGMFKPNTSELHNLYDLDNLSCSAAHGRHQMATSTFTNYLNVCRPIILKEIFLTLEDVRELCLLESQKPVGLTKHGLPCVRLQRQLREFADPFLTHSPPSVVKDILTQLAYMCHTLNRPKFETACMVIQSLPPMDMPPLFNKLLEYYTSNQRSMTVENMKSLLKVISRVCYQSSCADRFLKLVEESLQPLKDLHPASVLQILCYLSELSCFPEESIKTVFQAPYLHRLAKFLQSPDLPYHDSRTLVNNTIRLNRAVCILRPQYGVHFLRDLVDSQPQTNPQAHMKYQLFVAYLHDLLARIVDGPGFIEHNVFTSEGLHIDLQIILDENMRSLKPADIDCASQEGKRYKKIAFLCLDKDSYCSYVVNHSLTGEATQKVRLLTELGYRVIELPYYQLTTFSVGKGERVVKSLIMNICTPIER